MRSGLLALAVLLAVLAVAAPPDAAMENRPIILHAYVCLNASEVGNVYNAAFSVYVDGEGFRPAAVYVEGEVVPAVYPNITDVFYTVVAPRKPAKICLDMPTSRKALDAVAREAEEKARARGVLLAIPTPRGVGYLLAENRTGDVPPIVKWPSDTPAERPKAKKDITPRQKPEVATSAATGEVVGYVKSVLFNFTRHSRYCVYPSSGREIVLPNGTLWVGLVLTNATSRGTYSVYINLYDEAGNLIYFDTGASVTVDKKAPAYLARHVDVPASGQNKVIRVSVRICGGPTDKILDGYLLFRVRASDYYASYVRYPIQPGAIIVVKNALTQPSLNDVFSNGTYVSFATMEIPPGHWAGTGSLAADLTIKLCTAGSSSPPPSYFGPLNLYYGPHWIGSASAAAQSCGWQNIGGYSLYCCTYRINSWSWINAPDSVAVQYGLRNPAGYPLIIGPIPTSSGIIYADVAINTLSYRGLRRPDIAPPDSQVFAYYAHNFVDIVLEYWNVRGTSGVATRIDIRTQYAGDTRSIPYIPIVISPHVLGNVKYSVPDRLDVIIYSPYQIFDSQPRGATKTLIPSTTLRDAIDVVSPVLDFLGILGRALQYVNEPRVKTTGQALTIISTVGRYIVESAVSTYYTSLAGSYSFTVIANIGLAEKQTQHALRVYSIINTAVSTEIQIASIIVWEGSSARTYRLDVTSPMPTRITAATQPVYAFRNFFCLFNEPVEGKFKWTCNYGGFR
ncbi:MULTISPECIES: hypothetical protein [Pyrobaculum]|uniref:Family 59 protein n=2 Tax=Pyrobaculum arsenaticum TaxID=121277 RepID=A4WMW4_PYRAR|nr:hypothetical protein [Pyrobaculum arsenaticum]ABP51731.1 hypothetical protein Pars_2185 [Pyrobaculum arsenaticum DSM 13514]MCY0890075.1 hypothetical protein [Pyrobaculum arsenaticum]NYR16051.1 hypothetical protein [Pyrobaculum arsenaticum]